MTPTFLYLHCADLERSRRFHTDLVGLDQIFLSADDGVVGYRVGSLQVTFAVHESPEPSLTWSRQLGWEGGTGGRPSWGVELGSERFAKAVEALCSAGVERHRDRPVWVGYWSFPVRDPDGHTLELSTRGSPGG